MKKKRISKSNKRKNNLFWIIVIASLVIAVVFGFFADPKLVMVILFFILLIITYIFYRKNHGKKIIKETIIAVLMSLALVAYGCFEYTNPTLTFGILTLFPLVAWTIGLLTLKQIYNLQKKHKFLFTTLYYIIGLFLIEYIGYYILGIQLDSNYPGIPGLNIIHAPLAQQIAYILMGPIYLLITKILRTG